MMATDCVVSLPKEIAEVFVYKMFCFYYFLTDCFAWKVMEVVEMTEERSVHVEEPEEEELIMASLSPIYLLELVGRI